MTWDVDLATGMDISHSITIAPNFGNRIVDMARVFPHVEALGVDLAPSVPKYEPFMSNDWLVNTLYQHRNLPSNVQ